MLSYFSHVQLCVTLWPAACQAPLFMRFSQQEYWSWMPCPLSGDLLNSLSQGWKPHLLCLLHWQADTLKTWGVLL